MPALSSDSAIMAPWALGLGTVYPWVLPLWLIEVARITPWMLSPSASARDSGLSSTAPTPSPGTKPSPPSPKLRQRPSEEDIVNWDWMKYLLGCSDRLTPPARASWHSSRRRLSTARCSAVSDDEQMVSTAMLGPLQSKT